PPTSRRPRVVVVGAGFGGLAAARGLRHAPVEVTVIDRTNHHLFQPMLYQVATGLLSPGEIAPALRKVLRRQHTAVVLLAEATDVDLATRQVEVFEAGGSTRRIGYDYLVVAAGSHPSYFGHDDWAEHLYPMKSLIEAIGLRDQILCAYARAIECDDPAERARWKSFVIVGAGPTGVELAGQLTSLARELDSELRQGDTNSSRIVLIDALSEVLSTFPPALRAHTHQRLTVMGVQVRLDTSAVAVDAAGITVKATDGHTERIDTHTVIWTAGVHASPLAATLAHAAGVDLDHKGRVPVQADCSLPGHREVFVIGDMASLHDLPGLSEPAIQEGRYVAKVLCHVTAGAPPPGPFHYRDLGTMATISPKDAVAEIFGLKLHGRLGKLAWATVHIAFLVGWGNRVGVLARWAFLLGSRTRSERVILSSVHDGNTTPAESPSTKVPGRASNDSPAPDHNHDTPRRPGQLAEPEKRQ
nr:NAD(P)/FAD-dependent oxidoreductase [Actinomycetota bacterium]